MNTIYHLYLRNTEDVLEGHLEGELAGEDSPRRLLCRVRPPPCNFFKEAAE